MLLCIAIIRRIENNIAAAVDHIIEYIRPFSISLLISTSNLGCFFSFMAIIFYTITGGDEYV